MGPDRQIYGQTDIYMTSEVEGTLTFLCRPEFRVYDDERGYT